MSSTSTAQTKTTPIDDRSTKARIRDAAIQCFAENGIPDTTARKVATRAGVSAGSVIHHFESMDGLRAACDHYVIAFIREQKTQAMRAGPNLDVLSALRNSSNPHLMQYLARILTEDTDAINDLVEGLVSDAERYLEDGVVSGMLEPTDNPRARAVVLTLWGLGALVMHRHLTRLLGVDLVDPNFSSNPDVAQYLAPVMEIYGNGIFTDAFVDSMASSLAGVAAQKDHTETKEGTS